MRPLILALPLICAATAAGANTVAINACIAAVQEQTGRTLSEFDATYRQKFLQPDIVRWPGVECTVMDGKVRDLKVDGQAVVVAGWPSPEAKRSFQELAAETQEAIQLLQTRQGLLQQRLIEAEAALRPPGADTAAVKARVRDGIAEATGR